jgi:hypothetical protein
MDLTLFEQEKLLKDDMIDTLIQQYELMNLASAEFKAVYIMCIFNVTMSFAL